MKRFGNLICLFVICWIIGIIYLLIVKPVIVAIIYGILIILMIVCFARAEEVPGDREI